MPLATVNLLALASSADLTSYLRDLRSSDVKPLVIAKPQRWIIKPEKLSTTPLLSTQWDLLLIIPASQRIPASLTGSNRGRVAQHWSVTVGVPKAMYQGFEDRNAKLLKPHTASVPALTGSLHKPRMASSAQGLELNEELRQWADSFTLGQQSAVSMLNLLAFHSGPEAHESYKKYGQAFAKSIGSKRGGNAKIVGKVVPQQGTQGEDIQGWEEVALAHYPSIRHFVDMLASEDYQEVNHQYRLPALRDTCILCTSELDPALDNPKAKL